MSSRRFSVIPGIWAIVRLPADAPVPNWVSTPPPFVSVTRTDSELSIVCPASAVPSGCHAENGWALLKLHGPFPFSEVGVLSSFAAPLASAGISIFAISTFDTDYILIKAPQTSSAISVLVSAGHELVP